MGILSADAQRLVREQRLAYVATVSKDGKPNLSPKGTTTVWDDDHLVFADLASPRTVENIRHRPDVEVNVVDPIRRKGLRFRGVGRVLESGPEFEAGLRFFEEKLGLVQTRERVHTVVMMRITEVEPLISPAYDLGLTEEEVVARWRKYWADRGETAF